MDIQLQELLDKIRKDGLDAGKAEAAAVLSGAEAEARAIVKAAEDKARELVEKAKADAARFQASANAAIAQSSRTLLLAFREQVQKTLAALVRVETAKAFDAETLSKAMIAATQALAKGEALEARLSEKDANALKAKFGASLSKELGGMELKPVPNVKAGFKLSERDGAAYYDFSAEAVADMLAQYLSADTAALMRNAADGA